MTTRTAKLISAHLDAAGWSQLELSRKAGVSHQNIGNWCRGRATPGADGVSRLAKALGLSMEDEITLTVSAAAEGSPRPEVWLEIARRCAGEASPKNHGHRLLQIVASLLTTGDAKENAALVTAVDRERVYRIHKRRKASRG